MSKTFVRKLRLSLVFIFIYFYCIGLSQSLRVTKAVSTQRYLPIVKLLGNFEAYLEMSALITDSFQKFGRLSCTTVVWDRKMSSVLDYINFCPYRGRRCSYNYMVNFEEGNMTEDLTTAFRAGYKEQCGAYIILLSSTTAVTDLLHFGDDLRIINTRARFLIWYPDLDKNFETDDIWKKLPNIILFHANLRRKTSKNRPTPFRIITFKWPVTDNLDAPTRIIEFWRYGKVTKSEEWYKDKTTDLKNVTLRILAVEHPPSVIKYSSPDGYVEYAGTEIELVKELSTIMNFDFELVDADPITKWGGQIVDDNSTRHFYGAVARLIYGETDMAIGSFFILKHYLDYLDMSIPLDVACTSFLTPNPLPRPRYLALILPFRYQLWILVLSICFIFAPVGLYALTKLPLHATEYRLFSERSQTLLTSLSIISQVALHIWPKFWPIRMFIGWYWLFCLLITLAYRGAMVSFLTIPLYEKPIDSISDLAASGLRIGGWGTELYTLFTQLGAVEEDSVKLFLSRKYELIDDYDNGISMVVEGKFALYENIRYLKFIRMTRNLTKMGTPAMRLMKQCIVPVHMGIAYQKNSPIAPTINRHIRRFQESGLMKRWSQRLISRTKQYDRELIQVENDEIAGDNQDEELDKDGQEDDSDGQEEAKSSKKQRKQRVLTFKDLQGAIYLILFGMLVSLGVFIGEIFVAHSKRAAQNVNKELKKIVDKTTKSIKNGPQQQIHPMLQEMNLGMNIKSKMKKFKMKKLRKSRKEELLFPYLE